MATQNDKLEIMEDIMKDYLPIGSIVKTNKINKKLMIVGFSQIRDDEKIEQYDYVSVLYPAGVFSEDSFLFFNSDDINEVLFKGYEDDEREEFLKIVSEAENMIETAKNELESNNSAFK